MAQREFPTIRANDYLTLDQTSQDVQYEYLEGELRMLAGGSPDHSIIGITFIKGGATFSLALYEQRQVPRRIF
jgi:hypothetical protein